MQLHTQGRLRYSLISVLVLMILVVVGNEVLCDIDVIMIGVDHGALVRSWEGILSSCALSLQSCSCWCAHQMQADRYARPLGRMAAAKSLQSLGIQSQVREVIGPMRERRRNIKQQASWLCARMGGTHAKRGVVQAEACFTAPP